MPKINQTIIITPGGAKRLMVRGVGKFRVRDVTGHQYFPGAPTTFGEWREVRKTVKLDGPYIGTKKVPRENAKKHPLTGQPQTRYLLVRHPRNACRDNQHAVPPSDAEFYWQKGQMKNGRFYPDKPEVTPPQTLPPDPSTP